jgi:hypothetical protein
MDVLKPSVWDRDIQLIKDKGGWGKQFQADAEKLSSIPPRPIFSEKELVDLDNRFWIMFMDVYRVLLRGDYDKPYPVYLELLSFTIPVLLHLLPAEEPARQLLSISHYDHETPATITHMCTLLDAYLDARGAVIRRYNLSFIPDQIFENTIIKLVNRGA